MLEFAKTTPLLPLCGSTPDKQRVQGTGDIGETSPILVPSHEKGTSTGVVESTTPVPKRPLHGHFRRKTGEGGRRFFEILEFLSVNNSAQEPSRHLGGVVVCQSWTSVGGSDDLPLVLRPLFIEVCGIFSGRLGQDNACTIYKLYNILILYNSENVSLCTDYRLQFA